MKLLFNLLVGLAAANDDADYSDDLRYTRCQAIHLKVLSNITIPESHITEDPPGFICPNPINGGEVDAWQQGVRKWDQNKNSATGKYDVGYFYESESDSNKVNTIDNKLKEWGEKTCVNFKKVSRSDSKYAKKIKISFSGGCASYVGSHYAEQQLWLGPRCENSYIPLHEAMHAVGFWHEHQRGDRDQHVQINAAACSMSGNSFDVNFGKSHYTWGNTGHAYDFGSIMHYDPFACARSRSNPVITYPGTNDAVRLTKTDTFSQSDIDQINQMYPCDLTQTTKPPTTKSTTTQAPTTQGPGIKEWHGNRDIATWEFVNGLRSWHGDNNCLFDNVYGDRNMYHSSSCENERGIKITFRETVKVVDLKFFTRQLCCRERYNNVCMLVDGVDQGICTGDQGDDAPKVIQMADYMQGAAVGKEFYLKWPEDETSCAQVEELFIYYDNDLATTTQKPTTKTTQSSTTKTEGRERNCPQKRVRPPISQDTCVDLNDIDNINMKVEKDGGYSDGQNHGSAASVQCNKGYILNLENKLKTKATCQCVNRKCNWVFTKGDIMCVKCAANALQGKDGRAIQVVNEWETEDGSDGSSGITIQWRIKAYAASSDGWGVGLKLDRPLQSDSHWIESFALDNVGKSNDWQYFTFTPKPSSNFWDVNDWPKRTVPMMTTFNFRGYPQAMKEDIELVKKASNYYYKALVEDQSCFVDAFDCYPRL